MSGLGFSTRNKGLESSDAFSPLIFCLFFVSCIRLFDMLSYICIFVNFIICI